MQGAVNIILVFGDFSVCNVRKQMRNVMRYCNSIISYDFQNQDSQCGGKNM